MSYEGSSATIGDKGGYVLCTTSPNGNNFSTSWVMIQGTNGYAQSGNMYRWGYASCVKRWAEQAPPGGAFVDYYIGGCTTPNTSNKFWEQTVQVNGSYVIRSKIDTTVIRQSMFDPYDWTGKLDASFFSEAIFVDSNVPGSAAAPEDWSNMQVQNLGDDSFYDTCTNANMGMYNDNGNSTRWGLNAAACDHINSWTK